MDKARKKELLKAYADKQRQSFKDSLPMDEELFWNLFDYVDEKLETNDGCDHSLTFTREFLEKQSVDVESVLAWIISREEQIQEIQSSKLFLENLLHTDIDIFAYPFGHKESFDQVTEQIVQDLGFTYSVSTKRAQIHSNTNPFSIPRFGIEDWSEDEFIRQMKLVWFEN